MLKDLIEHIRAVHFALVLASTVLLVGALTRPSRAHEQASRDAQAIAGLAQHTGDLLARIEARANQRFGLGTRLDGIQSIPSHEKRLAEAQAQAVRDEERGNLGPHGSAVYF